MGFLHASAHVYTYDCAWLSIMALINVNDKINAMGKRERERER